MTIAIAVTIGIFCIGVIYHAGQISARVDSLEHWRNEVREEIAALRLDLRAGIVRLEQIIRREEH